MNSKKLVKVIKTLVEAEVAKKHESFMKKTLLRMSDERKNHIFKLAESFTHNNTK